MNQSTVRVLILEDKPLWQNTHMTALDSPEFDVTICDNVDDALRAIHERYYHVAIIDLQMFDGDEEMRGRRLLKAIAENGWLEEKMVTCVVSHWSDISQLKPVAELGLFEADEMKEQGAKGYDLNGILYFSKIDYEPDSFRERIIEELEKKQLISSLHIPQDDIVRTLAQRMTRNLIEHIESSSRHDRLAETDEWLLELYRIYQEETSDMSPDAEGRIYQRVYDEVQDLLLRSLEEVEEIRLNRIGNGFSKASVVGIMGKQDGIFGNEQIVKLGYHREIEAEHTAYKRYVSMKLKRRPGASEGAQTPLLASMLYDFVDQSQSFEEAFFRLDSDELDALLTDLFRDACKLWYASSNEDTVSAEDYIDYLHCYPARFDAPLEHLEHEAVAEGYTFRESDRIRFPGIVGDFPNPVALMENDDFMRLLDYPAKLCTTHGDFNANNILVKRNGDSYEAWLIDFARTRQHHALRDFIQLETVIKFILLRRATLPERYDLEKALLQQRSFDDIARIRTQYDPQSDNAAALKKVFRAVCKIRELAWDVVLNRQQSPVSRFEQYQMGLFFLSLNTVRFVKTPTLTEGIDGVQALHALMAAAMLAQPLAPGIIL